MTAHAEPDGPARHATTAEGASGALRFRKLFEEESSYVCRSVRRLGVPERDVPDATHDVFVAAYRHLDDYDDALPVRPWLFGIAYRVVLGYRRRKANQDPLFAEPADAPDEAPPADERIAAAEDRALVLRALDALPAERRAVFVMHEIDGTSMPLVAASLGIPLNTAYSRLRIGRDEFVAAVRRLDARGRR